MTLPTQNRSRTIRLAVWLIVIGLGCVRYFVFYRHNLLYRQADTQNYVVVAAAVFAAMVTLGAFRGPTARLNWSDAFAGIAAAVAVAIAFYAGIERFVPSEPPDLAAPVCPGALVHKAPARGQISTPAGLNARAGAGSDHESVNRFPNGCTLGFSGFCLGEPVTVTDTGLPDERWFIVYNRHQLVSAAYIHLQSARDTLHQASSRVCADDGGAQQPTLRAWTISSDYPKIGGSVTVNGTGGYLYGFALAFPTATSGGGYPYDQIGALSTVDGSKYFPAVRNGVFTPSAQLTLSYGLGYLPAKGVTTVEAVGAACLADDAPAPTTAIYKTVIFHGRALYSARPSARPHDSAALVAEACSVE